MTIDYCADIVRNLDYGRYLTTLFTPRKTRFPLWVLYALYGELMNIERAVTKEPMMGLVRLQWWHDAIDKVYAGQAFRHDVLESLLMVLQKDVPWTAQQFHHLIDSFEPYFRETEEMDTQKLIAFHSASGIAVLNMALELTEKTAHGQIIETVARQYETANLFLRGKIPVGQKRDLIEEGLRQLDNIPHQKLRKTPVLLLADCARYDFAALRRHRYVREKINKKQHDAMLAFYLWRRNPLLGLI